MEASVMACSFIVKIVVATETFDAEYFSTDLQEKETTVVECIRIMYGIKHVRDLSIKKFFLYNCFGK